MVSYSHSFTGDLCSVYVPVCSHLTCPPHACEWDSLGVPVPVSPNLMTVVLAVPCHMY